MARFYPLVGLLICLGGGHAEALSDDTLDARLIYSFGNDEYTVENNSTFTGRTEDDLTWRDNQRFRLDVLNAVDEPVAFLGGVSLAGQNASDAHAGTELDYQSLSGRVNLGIGVAAGDSVQLELLPFAGVGWSESDYSLPLGSGTSRFIDRDSARFFEYGLNFNAVFTNQHGFQLGGGIGYTMTDADYLFEDQSTTLDTEIEQAGPIYSVFIGTRL